MSENNPHNERVTISDALEYIEARTGFTFERRQFTRYVESGSITINETSYEIRADQIELRWFIARASIDAIISALLPVAGNE